MKYEDLLWTVKHSLASRQAINTTFIQAKYKSTQRMSRRVVVQLQEEGCIGKEWDSSLGGYPVLKQETSLTVSTETPRR